MPSSVPHLTDSEKESIKTMLQMGLSEDKAAQVIMDARTPATINQVPDLVKAAGLLTSEGKNPLRRAELEKGNAQELPWKYQSDPPEQIQNWKWRIIDPAKDFIAGLQPGWPGAILHGPFGRGKTSICCETMKLFAAEGFSSLFTILYDMVAEIKESWGDGSEIQERQAAKKFCKPALLVVDEAGVQFQTVAERNILYSVVVRRNNAGLPTLITTNCDLSTVEGHPEKFVNPSAAEEFYASVGSRVDNRFEGWKIGCSEWGINLRKK